MAAGARLGAMATQRVVGAAESGGGVGQVLNAKWEGGSNLVTSQGPINVSGPSSTLVWAGPGLVWLRARAKRRVGFKSAEGFPADPNSQVHCQIKHSVCLWA
jgi:hypothetical protein